MTLNPEVARWRSEIGWDFVDPAVLWPYQRDRFNQTLADAYHSAFYRGMWEDAGLSECPRVNTPADILRIPFTTKTDIAQSQQAMPPYGTLPTLSADQYVRVWRTSGSSGQYLTWKETEESWAWTARCWARALHAIGITSADRGMLAFAFGSFAGFWQGTEGLRLVGAMMIPTGGMSSQQRLEAIPYFGVTLLLSTPTYALHLLEAAEKAGIDGRQLGVRHVIVAGEQGGHVADVRRRLEEGWAARVYDFYGLTEVGHVASECNCGHGMHLYPYDFWWELIDPATGEQLVDGDVGELVLTNLARRGMPNIRYRTGDLVRIVRERCACQRTSPRIIVLGRVDDMIVYKGVNIYPNDLHNLCLTIEGVQAVRLRTEKKDGLTDLRLEILPTLNSDASVVARVQNAVRHRFYITPQVLVVSKDVVDADRLAARPETKMGSFYSKNDLSSS